LVKGKFFKCFIAGPKAVLRSTQLSLRGFPKGSLAISILLKECIHSKTRLPRLNAFGVQARNDRKEDSSLDVAKAIDLVYFKLASLLFPNL